MTAARIAFAAMLLCALPAAAGIESGVRVAYGPGQFAFVDREGDLAAVEGVDAALDEGGQVADFGAVAGRFLVARGHELLDLG